jgi:hypothetical protein
MLKKILSLLLVTILFQTAVLPSVNADDKAKKMPPVEKVKKSIEKFGVGEKARIKLKLRDGTKLKGYVYQAGDDSFTVVEQKTERRVQVAYADVQKASGNNRSTGQQIAIDVAAATAAMLIISAIGLAIGIASLSH